MTIQKSKRTLYLVIGAAFLLSCLLLAGIGWVIWQKALSIEPDVLPAMISPVVTMETTASAPTATARPTATKPVPLPTATAKPPVFFLWSRDNLTVELLDQPGGQVKQRLGNGLQVTPGESQEKDGRVWVHIWQGGLDGWVHSEQVWQKQGDLPLFFVQGADGVLLRDEPAGSLIGALPKGTPVLLIQVASVDGEQWAQVSLLDDRGGWVAWRLLGETP